MMGFQVGQVVVCIDASGMGCPDGEAGEAFPKEGGVYTVRALRPWEGTVALLLAEIVNPWFEWGGGDVGEVAFHSRRFRPAKTTSLEVFDPMLAPLLETV